VPAHGQRSSRRGVDGCYEVIDQLAGTALPASTWLRAVLPARVDDVHDGMLDELIGSGDVVWWGVSALSGGDGVVCLAPTHRAADLRQPGVDLESDPALDAVTAALGSGGAQFFREIADRVGVGRDGGPLATDADLIETLWRLVWAGRVTNDGWAALRARIGGGPARSVPRGGRPRLPARSGPPVAAGRWSLLSAPTTDPTRSAQAIGQALLDRHGIVTRGTVVSERVVGGFSAVYRVLSAFEDAGRCRRVYAVESLGAAQFAVPAAVDRLRSSPLHRADAVAEVVVLAATDPANAYGAAVPWPPLAGTDVTHRPGRKAGAVIALVDGEPAVYVERGGRSLLAWERPEGHLAAAATAIAQGWSRAGMDRAVITKINGGVPSQTWVRILTAAGFLPTPRGLRFPRG
jgi:ATP-dependent Lhr-like helicase